jgi:UDPglucose 6-dehydrogenase
MSRASPPKGTVRTVVIVGSGVVGTATGQGLQAKGHRVVFCDVAPERVALLRERGFNAIHADDLAGPEPDVYLISVPTPTIDGGVDRSYVRSASEAVGRAIEAHRGWPLVVVRSTVPPGTTEEMVIPVLESASFRHAGEDFGVCMNPEFLRAASALEDFENPKVIVIGALDGRSERALRGIYAQWPDVPVVATSLRTAEATKYVANLFNATKISFFNEMHRALLALGADPDVAFQATARAAEGLWNPTYGTHGGAPYAGVCLPKDTVGFLSFAEGLGIGDLLPILRAVVRTNEEMKAWAEEASPSAHEARAVSA